MNRPLHQIQTELKAAVAAQAAPLPDLAALEREVSLATARATLDPMKRGDLLLAVTSLEEAQARHQEQYARNTRVRELQQELSVAEAEERMAGIRAADATMDGLEGEFIAGAKQLCRLADQMRRQNLALTASVPGYKSRGMPSFDFAFFTPMGWQGRTSEHIKTSALVWLNRENDKAA